MAIDINKLKPIIEPFLTEENTIEVLSSIKAIDTDPTQDLESELAIRMETERAALRAEYNQKYREAFFGGQTTETQAEQTTSNINIDNPGGNELSFGALFTEGGN